jgi:hypothetical protein
MPLGFPNQLKEDPLGQPSPWPIVKALTENYRDEHVFTLRQALAAYRHYQQMIVVCDQPIESLLEDCRTGSTPSSSHCRSRGANADAAAMARISTCARIAIACWERI